MRPAHAAEESTGDEPAAANARWTHSVALRKQVGALALDVAFELTARWTVLFAPSGGGKTTVLRLLAGLERPDAGRIVSREPGGGAKVSVLTDVAARIFVPPHQREVRLVAQRPALFPHLDVARNIAFGRLSGGRRGALEARELERHTLPGILRLCRVEHLQARMPAELSGGERQRVALARALAAGPGRLLLLDEPFTGLEAGLRETLIVELRAWLSQGTTPVLMVTHDLGEVFAAEAEVVRLAEGRVAAQGPVEQVLAEERERLRSVLGTQNGR